MDKRPEWRKSSRSGGGSNCVEVAVGRLRAVNPLLWRKSSSSEGANNCVEVARIEPVVGVRDSKNVAGPRLSFPPATWSVFLAAIPSPM